MVVKDTEILPENLKKKKNEGNWKAKLLWLPRHSQKVAEKEFSRKEETQQQENL